MTLSPRQLMVSSSFGFSLCCPHLLLSILQANRTSFSCSFSVFPLGSAFPCLSDVTNGRMCPSAVSDHLTVHGALPAAARPHAVRVTDCPQTPCAAPIEHMGLLPCLDPGLAVQKQSSSGELPASLHGSCSSLVRCCAQLPWPHSSLNPTVCFGTGLACSSPFDPPSKIFP